MKGILQNKTTHATRWSAASEVTSRLVLPFVNVVLARLLTPDAFGVVATVTMIISFAEIFADAGFQKYIIQHKFVNKQELDENTNVAFWTNLIVSIVAWVIIFVWSEELASLVGNPGLGIVVVISALSLPLMAFSSIQMARFKRDMDFKSLFFVRIITICVPIIVTVPIAFLTHSYWSLVVGTISINFVNAIVLTIRSNWKPKFYYSIKHFKNMFSYSWWILMESISTWLTSYSDTFIVSMYLTPYFVGLYKTSMVTVNQLVGIIVAATSMPLFVTLTKLQNEKKKLIDTYNNYMKSVSTFIIPLSVGIWVFRDTITLILLGEQWMEASDFIGLWGLLSSITLVLGTYTNGLYNAVGKTFLSFIIALINLVFMIPMLLWAAQYGFECLYISRSSLRIIFVLSQLSLMAVSLRYPIGTLIKSITPPIVGSVAMLPVAFVIRLFSGNICVELLNITACAVTYFLVTRICFKNLISNSLDTLGLKLPFFKKDGQ